MYNLSFREKQITKEGSIIDHCQINLTCLLPKLSEIPELTESFLFW